MPCTDGGVPFPPTREEILNDKIPVPMLCALLSVLAKDGTIEGILSDIDWKEAGINQQDFDEWWRLHRLRDQQRRERELATTLPPGAYELKQLVQWKGIEWIVTNISVTSEGVKVRLVSMGSGPIKTELAKVRPT